MVEDGPSPAVRMVEHMLHATLASMYRDSSRRATVIHAGPRRISSAIERGAKRAVQNAIFGNRCLPQQRMQSLIHEFERMLQSRGLHAALGLLNSRTTHRFTGVYRFDGEWLRNVALFDRWNPLQAVGADAPMRETFCAIVPTQGTTLEVIDGSTDPRFPWMNENAVVSYCGTLIRAVTGDPFGTLCHFDTGRCEAASSQLFPLMAAAAPLIYRAVAAGPPARA